MTHLSYVWSVFLWTAASIAQDSAPPVPPEPTTAAVVGIADLHLHQWAHLSFAGKFLWGDADGEFAPCGAVHDRTDRRVNYYSTHARLGPRGNPRAPMFRKGLASDEYDDILPHPPGGPSADVHEPNFLGWPTSDTIAHQQAWEGSLRLAHDGPVFAHYLAAKARELGPVEGSKLTAIEAAKQFSNERRRAHAAAAAVGIAGLNLAVVSLVHAWPGCTLATTPEEKHTHGQWLLDEHRAGRLHLLPSEAGLEANQLACLDRPNIAAQYERALAWDARVDWADIVTSPAEASDVIARGKLAIVLSVEASDFLAAYAERLPEWPADEQVKASFHDLLDDMPKVATLQPVHQLDSALFGSAEIVKNLRRSQLQRLRTGIHRYTRSVLQDNRGEEDRSEARRHARTAITSHDEFFLREARTDLREASYRNTAYARWLYGSMRAAGGRGATGFALGANARKPDGMGKAYLRRGEVQQTRGHAGGTLEGDIPVNGLGMSVHGRLLLEVLIERGMPLDLSHMSEEASNQVMAHIDTLMGTDRASIVYLSHAIPRDALNVPRELTVSNAQISAVAQRQGVIGVRTADDPLWLPSQSLDPAPGPASRWFGAYLREPDCQESTIAFGYFLGWMNDLGANVAFGSDLNGFINHVGPTGILRGVTAFENKESRERLSRAHLPCAGVVAGVGSEVDVRGVAHVGLLPAAGLQLLQHTRHPRRSPKEVSSLPVSDASQTAATRSIESLWSSAEAYLQVWDRAAQACALSRDGLSHAGTPRRCPTSRQNVVRIGPAAPMTQVLDPLTDFGEQHTWTLGKPTASTVTSYLDRDLELPPLRLAEAVLPWQCEERGDRMGCERTGQRGQALPQLPTTIGFLTGITSFGAQHPTKQKRAMYRKCKSVWRGADREEGCEHIRRSPTSEFRSTYLDRTDGRALGGDYNRQFIGSEVEYAQTMEHVLGQNWQVSVDGVGTRGRALSGMGPAAASSSWSPSSLTVNKQLDNILAHAAYVSVATWTASSKNPARSAASLPSCFESDAYTSALTPGMFHTAPYEFEGTQALRERLLDMGDVGLVDRLVRGDVIHSGQRVSNAMSYPAHLVGKSSIVVHHDRPPHVDLSEGVPSVGEIGDACVCWLLERLDHDPATKASLTAFDQGRLGACRQVAVVEEQAGQ